MQIENQKSSNGDSTIVVNSVRKAFTSRLVLDDVNLCVRKGQSLCLCGVNGAGKSTLLRIITGLLEPDQGSIEICGFNLKKDREKAKMLFGVISHKSMVYPDLTVMENLTFFARLYGVKDSVPRAEQLLRDTGLEPYRYDRTHILSRGLLQRLAIARALVNKPVVLIMDEPFTGLDAESTKHLIAILSDFADNSGTIIMTTHDIRIGISCCDRVAVLDKQRLIFDSLVRDVDTDRFTQDYLSYARSKN
ncbi:MAG: heme ABC exporter ATP-binding protein CcmA [Sedimentisphaerales bacterium]